uniref:Gamma-synuclein n=1 Tax=Ornithorhynchus anatinus TaxID=9258 RepID=A0A6I8NY30_ORNAN
GLKPPIPGRTPDPSNRKTGCGKCQEADHHHFALSVAEKTKEQASVVSEAVVASVNTVANKTVEGAESIVVTTGVVKKEDLLHPDQLEEAAAEENPAEAPAEVPEATEEEVSALGWLFPPETRGLGPRRWEGVADPGPLPHLPHGAHSSISGLFLNSRRGRLCHSQGFFQPTRHPRPLPPRPASCPSQPLTPALALTSLGLLRPQ